MKRILSVPELRVAAHEYWSSGFAAVYSILQSNLKPANGFFRYPYALPAPKFRGVYLWDTAFIAQIWKYIDLKIARNLVLDLIEHEQNGRIPHFAHRLVKSRLTQPPLLSWTVWELDRWEKYSDFLAVVYPALKSYNLWLYKNRRMGNGLFCWQHHYGSGMDNSPRFCSRDE